jgi:hypothetical protein
VSGAPVLVVVGHVAGQRRLQMPLTDDQHPIQQRTTDRADPSLRDRVARDARTSVRKLRTPSKARITSNAAVNLASRSCIKNLELLDAVCQIHEQVASLLAHPHPCRRSTATSCRSTRISALLDAWLRVSRPSQPMS